MSGTISGIADFGTLGRLIEDSASVRQRLDGLSQQAASGKIAGSYAGLGDGARVSLDLRPALAHQARWQANIDAASGRMQVAQTAMTQVQNAAATLYAQLNNLNGLSAQELDTVAASARQTLQQVASVLDSKNGDVYVFAGQDTATPPVPNPDQILASGFYSQINTAVTGLGANAAPVAAATLGIAGSNAAGTTPFSASLSQPPGSVPLATVETGAAQRAPVGVLASANAFVASAGTSTTGSYMRDVLRAFATIGSLTSAQMNAGGFQGLVQDTRTSLRNAISAMAEDAGVLGDTQTRLAGTKTQLADVATALTAQVSNAEDVDMAATLSKISLTQTQLQASYQLIAGMNALSLVKYLTGG